MRKFVFILFFFCTALLPIFSLDDAQAVNAVAKNVETIIIDPAHGGVDPGAIGHHTINGDVWEWCWEYSSDTQIEWKGGWGPSGRVVRGGSFYDVAPELRSAYRYYYYPSSLSSTIGFRVARNW